MFNGFLISGCFFKKLSLNNGGFDLEGILKEVNEDTSLVWLCNPNNPTGTYFNHESLDSFLS
ncbi:aminotransferase class I/II-fold pyridoxal phosphate-dependent enzyme, partial [Staphylococcus aureus]|uniref:aminotransferase class I/II-fold pyridoxal phosphate-dependent enzyme n=1 Tax=Staphylococcus aureus TaxID=1280 RepID=UPI001F5B66EF